MHWLLLALFLSAGFVESRSAACASSKLLPIYADAFQMIETEDIVLEAKYISKEESAFRFEIILSWSLNNGGLNYMDRVQVIYGSQADTSITMCYDELVSKENYLLLLRRSDDASAFVAQLAPFSLRKNSRRDEIRQAWCNLPENECPLKISRDHLPPVVELFPGTNTILQCKIDSKTDLNEIRWLKDGKDIEEEGGDVYARNGIYVHSTNLRSRTSHLVIYEAHRMHSGIYSCVSRNAGGESTDLGSRVTVGSEPSAFGACPSWAEGYCQNSVCKSILGLPNDVKCECKAGRSGRRCQELSVPDLAMVTDSSQEMIQQIEELTARTIILASALVINICLVLYLIAVIVRRRRRRRLSSYITPHEDSTKEIDAEMGKS